MDKIQISQAIQEKHQAFITTIETLSEGDYTKCPKDKWSAAQQLEHIHKSLKPIDMAFGLPMFVLKMKFGLANRPSKNYDGLVKKYKKSLEESKNFTMPSQFAPDEKPSCRRSKGILKLEGVVKKLCSRLERFTEEELDRYILPHPLMGKLTLREMLYFSIYHAQHHDRQILENLKHAG